MGAILGGVAAAASLAGTAASIFGGSGDSGSGAPAQATPVDPGPYFTAMLSPNTGPGRSAVNPMAGKPMSAWYTYGQGPEQTFFKNNSVAAYAPNDPIAAAAAKSGAPNTGALALGGPTTGYARGGSTGPQGPLSSSAPRPAGHYVQGPGNGQSDSVDAKLSNGEWVADANFVSALGDGSNDAGAKVLYKMREAVMRDKGMKHIVPPKLKKGALSYAREAGAKLPRGAR